MQGRAHRVHFEVDQLTPGQRDDHLPHVQCTLCDVLLAWRTPFVDTLVGPDVPDPVRVNLKAEQ